MVQLEWQTDGKRGTQRVYQEDPQEKRQRRRGRWRLFFVLLIFLGIIAGALWLVSQRLNQVQQRYEQLLVETAQAEVASLRIGDLEGFLKLQRSATADWARTQERVFADYQARKAQTDILLTGRVLSVRIDGQRGRVQIEEIESGVPYVQTWFYWRYEDVVVDEQVIEAGGWHHVPPDYTFWDEAAQRQSTEGRFVVRYRGVDTLFATQVQQALDAWLAQACDLVACANLPFMTVDVLPASSLKVGWQQGEAWQLVLPSPYVGRARADQPFDQAYQLEVSVLLAERLATFFLPPVPPQSDAAFLRDALLRWWVGTWVQLDSHAYLLGSVVGLYGTEPLRQLFATLQPTDGLERLAQVLPTDLAQAPLDWRDFLTWRLRAENAFIAQRDETRWVQLVDTRSEAARLAAYARYQSGQVNLLQEVVSVTRAQAPDGAPQLRALVQDGVSAPREIVFNWVNGTWLRADA